MIGRDCHDVDWNPKKVYINFMARGEPLMNPLFRNDEGRGRIPSSSISQVFDVVTIEFGSAYQLWSRLLSDGIGISQNNVRINISTIMPKQLLPFLPPTHSLQSMFNRVPHTAVYYSLYSMADSYRSRWMPSAMNPHLALDMLKQWVDVDRHQCALEMGMDVHSLPPLTFHWPLIKDVNDSAHCIDDIVTAIRQRQFHHARFHLIAYNPPVPSPHLSSSLPSPSCESSLDRYDYAFQQISSCFPNPSLSKRIQRIGFDVHASCGTFFKQ